MGITQAELRRQLSTAHERGWDAISADAERARGLPPGLLLAIASRETDMNDIVTDEGHGRGLFQIDDRSWKEWLAAHGAGGRGKVPPVEDAATFAAWLVSENMAFGRKNGVKPKDLLKFALSAYNAGPGGALRGYEEGDSDRRTTGGDYGKDVLERLAAIDGRAPQGTKSKAKTAGGADDGILRVGDRGRRVLELKERLRQWFDQNAPGEWEAFGVRPGAVFGPPVERAVRAFQERKGLLVDGEVGPQTLGALGIRTTGSLAAAAGLPADLTLDRPVYRKGSGGLYVRLIQSWLTLGGLAVVPDGEFGPATAKQVKTFQQSKGVEPTGAVDQSTYDLLTAPMRAALAGPKPGKSLGATTIKASRQHLGQSPREVRRSPNDGPWVRLYMDGNEGDDWPWCAGFATYVLKQACAVAGEAMPIARTYSCDEMAETAKSAGIFLPNPSRARRTKIPPGSMFVRRASSGNLEYAHTGIVVDAEADTFRSIEGNTNDGGGFEGIDVRERVRSYDRMDFILIP